MGAYKPIITQFIPQLSRRLHTLETNTQTKSTLDIVMAQCRENDEFFPSLDFLVHLGEGLDDPSSNVHLNLYGSFALALGPHALNPIIDTLIRMGNLLEANRAHYHSTQYEPMHASISSLATPISQMVYYFRNSIPRSRWDPTGFRVLLDILHSTDGLAEKLPVRIIIPSVFSLYS